MKKYLFCTDKKPLWGIQFMCKHHVHIATKILSSWNFLLWCIRVILWCIRVWLLRKLSQCSLCSHHHSGGVQQKRGLLWSVWIFYVQPKVVVYTTLSEKQCNIFPLLSEHFQHVLREREQNICQGSNCCHLHRGSHPGSRQSTVSSKLW